MSLLDKLLVKDEIQRAIAEAIEDGDRVYAHHSASRIVQTYPNCGLTVDEIAKKIISGCCSRSCHCRNEQVGGDLERHVVNPCGDRA